MSSRICFNIDTKKFSDIGLFSRLLGNRTKFEEHYIDWDISVALLNDSCQIANQNNFIFYNNPTSGDVAIRLNLVLKTIYVSLHLLKKLKLNLIKYLKIFRK